MRVSVMLVRFFDCILQKNTWFGSISVVQNLECKSAYLRLQICGSSFYLVDHFIRTCAFSVTAPNQSLRYY